jgi:flagellar basal-body rod protein FlgB
MVSRTGLQLFDGLHDGLGRALEITQARQLITNGNLANVNTPGYLAKELPFSALLGEAMDRSLAHEEVDVSSLIEDRLTELEAPAWALDGNSVDLEREAARVEENKLFYQAVVGGTSRRLAMLRFAASDGRS